MKKVSILIVLFLLSNAVFSQSILTPSLSPNSVAIHDFLGFNGQNTNEPGLGFDNPDVINALPLVHASTLRFPGGTVANYWDWKNGNYIDPISPATNCFGLPYDYGATNPHNQNTLAHFKTALNRASAKPVWLLNLLSDDLASQLSMLSEAKILGLPVEYIELGNEFYLNNDCYEEKFPYAVSYGEMVKEWIPKIRSRFPNVRIACVGAASVSNVNDRRNDWNNNLSTYFGSIPAAERPDAFTIHDYKTSGLSVSNCSAINFASTKCSGANLHSFSSHLYGTVYNNFDQIISDDFPDINPPGTNNYKYWITEYNLLDRDNNIHGSWAHALHTAEMTLLYLKKANEIELADCHTLIGNGIFSAILNSNDGYTYSNSVSNPFCSPCTAPINGTTQYTLSSLGLVMNEIGTALKNAVSVREIFFAGTMPLVTSANCSSPITSNAGVISWLTTDAAGNTNVLFLNLSAIATTITNVNGAIFGGANLSNIYFKQYGFGLNDYLTDYNPASNSVSVFNNSICDPATLINNIGLSQNPSPTGEIELTPFSITRAWFSTNNILISSNANQFCEGTDFLLTAITNPNASNFQWYKNGSIMPGATSQNYAGTASLVNDIYSVSAIVNTITVTSSNFSINVHAKPIITIPAGLNQIFCTGTNITIDAVVTGGSSSNYFYNWSPGSNIDPPSSLTSSLNYSLDKTKDFTFYVSDGTCTSKEVVRVIVLGDYDFDLIPDRICQSDPFEIELLTPSGINATYLWNDGSTTNTFHLPNTSGPNYSVSINYAFSGGNCSINKSFTSYQVGCCSISGSDANVTRLSDVADLKTQLGGLSNVSVLTYGANGGESILNNSNNTYTILVTTTFSPDVDLKLKNFTIKLTDGARIIVKPYRILNLIDCNIESCGSTLWDGIIVEEHGKLITKSSLATTSIEIADARNGVLLKDYSEYSIINTKFKNNLIGVKILGDIGKPNRSFGIVSGNTFYTDNSSGYIKSPYTGMVETYGGQAFSGIDIENGVFVMNTSSSSSNLNYFYNLSCGVNAKNSVLSIGNVRFKDLYTHPLVNSEWKGVAVYNEGYLPAIGTSSYTEYDNISYTNSFLPGIENARYGIRHKRGFISVKNEIMSAVRKGIYVSDVLLDRIVLNFNSIDAIEEGITCFRNDGASVIYMFQNNISVNNQSLNANSGKMESWGIGILEQGLKENSNTSQLKCNSISINKAYYGIFISNTKELFLGENSVFMNNMLNKCGISFFATSNSFLSQNGVDGIAGLPQQSRGFLFSMSTENDLVNNSSNNTGLGFDFWNINAQTNLIGNRIGSHYIGLHINKSGIIGPQFLSSTSNSNGNRWVGYNTGAGYGSGNGAVNENIGSGGLDPKAPTFSQFLIDNSNTIGNLYYPINEMTGFPNSNNTDWFKANPGIPPVLVPLVTSCVYNDYEISRHIYSSFDSLIVQDSITANEFGAEVRYIVARDLFEILQKDSVKLLGSEFYKNFYDSLIVLNIGQFGRIRDFLKNIYSVDSSLTIAHEELNYKLSSNLARIKQIQELLAIGNLTLLDSQNLISEGKYLAYGIGSLKKEKEKLSTNFNLIVNERIQYIIDGNDGISPNNLIEFNEKQVNDFLLKRLLYNQSQDSVDFSLLQSIAQQCPFSGGRSVYIARTILYEYFPDMVYNDEEICTAEGLMRKSNEISKTLSNRVLISPNPTSDVVNVIYNNDNNPIVRTVLYSLEGKILLAQNSSLPIVVKEFSQGLYLINCITKNGDILTSKLTILK